MEEKRESGSTDSVVINATPEEIWDVLLDIESYPEWMSGVPETQILKRDSKKRPKQVKFVVDAVLTKVTYVLAYTYNVKERTIETSYVEGDLDDTKSRYTLEPLDDERTEVTYYFEISYALPRALKGPLASRLLKQVDRRVMKSALNDLKSRAESLS